MWIAASTRPDISFATNYLARYSSAPLSKSFTFLSRHTSTRLLYGFPDTLITSHWLSHCLHIGTVNQQSPTQQGNPSLALSSSGWMLDVDCSIHPTRYQLCDQLLGTVQLSTTGVTLATSNARSCLFGQDTHSRIGPWRSKHEWH